MKPSNSPVIGILPTFNLTNTANDPYLDIASFVSMYWDCIKKSGGIPIGLLDTDISKYLDLCDGFLWPGGNKLHPSFLEVVNHAMKTKKPLLGICLGAQGIATFLNILEDIKTEPTKTLEEIYNDNKKDNPYLTPVPDEEFHNHYVTKDEESINAAKHEITLKKESLLYSIFKAEKIMMPSMHKMMINRTSKDTLINAKTRDGVIEGIEYTKDNNKILGVQFHPELLGDLNLFTWLIENCQK